MVVPGGRCVSALRGFRGQPASCATGACPHVKAAPSFVPWLTIKPVIRRVLPQPSLTTLPASTDELGRGTCVPPEWVWCQSFTDTEDDELRSVHTGPFILSLFISP